MPVSVISRLVMSKPNPSSKGFVHLYCTGNGERGTGNGERSGQSVSRGSEFPSEIILGLGLECACLTLPRLVVSGQVCLLDGICGRYT